MRGRGRQKERRERERERKGGRETDGGSDGIGVGRWGEGNSLECCCVVVLLLLGQLSSLCLYRLYSWTAIFLLYYSDHIGFLCSFTFSENISRQ